MSSLPLDVRSLSHRSLHLIDTIQIRLVQAHGKAALDLIVFRGNSELVLDIEAQFLPFNCLASHGCEVFAIDLWVHAAGHCIMSVHFMSTDLTYPIVSCY